MIARIVFAVIAGLCILVAFAVIFGTPREPYTPVGVDVRSMRVRPVAAVVQSGPADRDVLERQHKVLSDRLDTLESLADTRFDAIYEALEACRESILLLSATDSAQASRQEILEMIYGCHFMIGTLHPVMLKSLRASNAKFDAFVRKAQAAK